jgi:hypothetical protein
MLATSRNPQSPQGTQNVKTEAVQPKKESASSRVYDSFARKFSFINKHTIGRATLGLTGRGASTLAQRAVEFYAPIAISSLALSPLAQAVGGFAAFGVIGPLVGPVVATGLGLTAGYAVSFAVGKVVDKLFPQPVNTAAAPAA